MPKNKHRLVVVDWVDSAGNDGGWLSMSDILEVRPAHCRSVGWIIDETDDYLHLLPHRGLPDNQGKEQGFGNILIPKRCIDHIRKIPEKR